MGKKGRQQKNSAERPPNSSLVTELQRRNYTFLGKKWDDCGLPLQISLNTMYEIQNMNAEAQSAKDLIANMIGKKGIRFIKGDKKIVDDRMWEKRILSLFTDPLAGTFQITKDKFYTHHFCSGEVNVYLAQMGDGSHRVQILDSRHVKRYYDGVGNMTSVSYNGTPIDMTKYKCYITKYNTENPYAGKSSYETIVFDALSDNEAGKRNFYFFRNNAMPNLILTMEDDITNQDEIEAAITRFESNYKGSENSNKVLASSGIKEVKTIDFNNKDLELLELKKFSIKQLAMIFRIDPRFLGYRDGENGSHSEYDKMAAQSDKSMISFAEFLETVMYNIIEDLYPIDFPYYGIVLENDRFIDEDAKVNMMVKLVQNGILTPKNAIEELGFDVNNLPPEMDEYFINIQYDTIANIIGKSQAAISQTEASTEASKATTKAAAAAPAPAKETKAKK